MTFIIGVIVVLACVLGGYMANGGHLFILWQPFEFVIIVGAAIGGVVFAHPPPVMARPRGDGRAPAQGPTYTHQS